MEHRSCNKNPSSLTVLRRSVSAARRQRHRWNIGAVIATAVFHRCGLVVAGRGNSAEGALMLKREPVIFADTLAQAMLGERAEELISYHLAHGTHPVLAGARAQVTCRSRYTEDRLADAIGRGIGQYVLLGAGLDSFAYRSPLAGRVRVFEVDHPATQEYKRRVRGTDLVGQAAADWGEPWRSVFAPGAMAALLARHGFGPARDVGQR